MFTTLKSLSLLLATLAMFACGGDEGGGITGPAGGQTPASQATSTSPGGSAPRPGGGGQAPASVDVCNLFTSEDARAVIQVTNPGGNATMTSERRQVSAPLLGSCRFSFTGTPAGTLEVQAWPASAFAIHKAEGRPVAGVGDEAVSVRGATYVRAGQVMLSSAENSFTESFVVEVYKRMAPKLK